MNKFDIKCPFIHKFNVVVPNFSSFDSLVAEINYEEYVLKTNLSTIDSFGTITIEYLNEYIKLDINELLNVPINIMSNSEIVFDDNKIGTIEGFPSNFSIKSDVNINAKSSSIEKSNVEIKDTTKIELETIVGVLVKLGELDPLTLGDLDGKTLNELYYKTI